MTASNRSLVSACTSSASKSWSRTKTCVSHVPKHPLTFRPVPITIHQNDMGNAKRRQNVVVCLEVAKSVDKNDRNSGWNPGHSPVIRAKLGMANSSACPSTSSTARANNISLRSSRRYRWALVASSGRQSPEIGVCDLADHRRCHDPLASQSGYYAAAPG